MTITSAARYFFERRFGQPSIVVPPGTQNLGQYTLELYRQEYFKQLEAGNVKPLVVPYAVYAVFLLILYLAIPHTKRPWLYWMRWPLMVFVVLFGISEVVTTSSANVSMAYVAGLMNSWGILWSATLLIWTRPQWEAARVEKRPRGTASGLDGHASNGSAAKANGDKSLLKEGLSDATQQTAPDEDMQRNLDNGYEYYWQAFPADGTFLERLNWSMDLVCSHRGQGWNWAITSIPHFKKPETALSGELVDLGSIPVSTPSGYRRCTTNREFWRTKGFLMIRDYLVLDVCSVLMMKDPYFVQGPEHGQPLPALVAAMPLWLRFLSRSMLSLVGFVCGLHWLFTSWQVICHALLWPVLGTRAELWHYPSVNGPFSSVLDKGVAGFWGSWWHQTFRYSFGAPTTWLARRGHLDPSTPGGKTAALLIAFAQSGFLHVLGSMTCLPPTKPWLPPLFFIASFVGVVLQQLLCRVFRPTIDRMPVRVRRAGNLAYTLLWMGLTQWLFVDDIARSGVWMFEPVPVSFVRMMGLGKPGDSWFRWSNTVLSWPSWYSGKWFWWQSGVGL